MKILSKLSIIISTLMFSIITYANADIKVVTSIKPIHSITSYIMDGVGSPDLLVDGYNSPHNFQLKPSHAKMLQNADLVIFVGEGIEEFLEKPLESIAKDAKKFALLEQSGFKKLKFREINIFEEHDDHDDHDKKAKKKDDHDDHGHDDHGHGHGEYDPHIWFDVTLWVDTVDAVVEGLSKADSAHAVDYKKNGEATKAKMNALHEWSLEKVKELPEAKRILITSHDAYNYFGRAYGFKVVGLQGISTVSEASLADVAKMVDFIKENKVKAVFVESSVSPAAIKRISEDSGAVIGGELFSDAMGERGKMEHGYDVGTYEGMIKHNLSTIVDALK